MSSPARRVRESLFTGVSSLGNLNDALLNLILKLVENIDPTPSSPNDAQSVFNYLHAVDGDSLATQHINARLNDLVQRTARR